MKELVVVDIHLLDLPGNDIILKIIEYLSPDDWLNFRAVCKRTYFLVNDYFKYMRVLDLSRHSLFPHLICQILAQLCRSLRVVKISNSNLFSDEALRKLFQNNHNLSHLDLSNCFDLKNGILQPLVVNCKKLQVIILRNCPWLTVGAIQILAFHYPEAIKVADFSGCSGISQASVILFIKRQPRLESLSLGNLGNIRDETLTVISRTCQHLTHLDLTRCSGITDSGIRMLGEYCNSLRSLKAEGCPEVSERSLSKLRSRNVLIDKLQYPPYLLHRQNQIQTWPRTLL